MGGERVDLAIVGAGIAGAYLADRAQQEFPSWSICVFERSHQIGGRLRSAHVPGLDHPIELGGMRFMSTHSRVVSIVDDFGVATRPFNTHGGGERAYLRGVAADGPGDPASGANYGLAGDERGRSAVDLWSGAFDQIVPGWAAMDHESFARLRASGEFLGRRLTDWSVGEALGTLLSNEANRYVRDGFGYDSGIRPFNAADFLEFLASGGDPTAEARTPQAGMDVLPRSLAARFEQRGGSIRLGQELVALDVGDGALTLEFANGTSVQVARVVLTLPVPALELLATRSPVLQQPAFQRVFDSVEGFPAMKLYAWYDRAWWRPRISAIRSVTDLPVRKVFYLDDDRSGPGVLLALYVDGRHVDPWVTLAGDSSDGEAVPAEMLAEVQRCLRQIHPEIAEVPEPLGSAVMHWGRDPHEVGWHFWRAGAISDGVLAGAPHPDANAPIYVAGEAFSLHQSWVEGALESADAVLARLRSGATMPELRA